MRVVVIGAGLIGVTTAWYLAERGHAVTVLDRNPAPGEGASFANGCLVTPSTSDSWAAPGTPLKILKWLGHEDAPMLLRLRALPGMASWGLRFLRECHEPRWRANTRATFALARASLVALDRLAADHDLQFDRNPPGLIKLFRDPLSMDSAVRASRLYAGAGLSFADPGSTRMRRARSLRWRRSANASPAESSTPPTRAETRMASCRPWRGSAKPAV